MTEGRRWYVVQTQARAETRVAAHLERQGFHTYLPRWQKRRRHARRIDVVAAPLFPRYLFVAIDLRAQRWRAIHSTVGVSCFVCNGNAPAAVPAAIVDDLKRREDGDGFVALDQRPRFTQGQAVRVLDGVFEACLGLFDGMTDGQRVAVLLDLLGRKVRVALDDLSVAAA